MENLGIGIIAAALLLSIVLAVRLKGLQKKVQRQIAARYPFASQKELNQRAKRQRAYLKKHDLRTANQRAPLLGLLYMAIIAAAGAVSGVMGIKGFGFLLIFLVDLTLLIYLFAIASWLQQGSRREIDHKINFWEKYLTEHPENELLVVPVQRELRIKMMRLQGGFSFAYATLLLGCIITLWP